MGGDGTVSNETQSEERAETRLGVRPTGGKEGLLGQIGVCR